MKRIVIVISFLLLIPACSYFEGGQTASPVPGQTRPQPVASLTQSPLSTSTQVVDQLLAPTQTSASLPTLVQKGEDQVCGSGENRVVVLVSPEFVGGIRAGLDQFETDLCAEGYSTWEHAEDFKSPVQVREWLIENYLESKGELQGVIFIGSVPYAYQSFRVTYSNPEIADHDEEVISYQYYSDLDGDFSTSPDYVSPGGHPFSFDIHQGDVDWEIWTGVLPVYRGDSSLTIDALNRYFEKNHAYRVGEYDLPRAYLFVNEHFSAQTQEEYQLVIEQQRSGQYAWTPFSESANAYLYFDAPQNGITAVDGYQALSDGVADFAILSAHGYWGGHGQIDLSWLNDHPLRTVFFWSNGCAVGNLDYPGNFLTEALYSPGSLVLAAKGTTNDSGGMGTNEQGFFGHNIAEAMAGGASIGDAILAHVNVPLIEPWLSNQELHFAPSILLGDPTLKLRGNK